MGFLQRLKRNIWLLLIAILANGVANAQLTLQIGTGTSTQRFPLGTYYGYERTASLYTSAELASLVSNNITAIGWYAQNITGTTCPTKIYLKTVTGATLTSQTWANMIVGATLVYDGTATVSPANSWYNINLLTSFIYLGDNLLVLVESSYTGGGTGSSTGLGLRYSTSTNTNQTWLADSNPPTGNGSVNSNRPNVQFTYMANSPCSGTPAPGNTVTTVDSVCPNINFPLNLQNVTVGSGVSYQWESADDIAFTINLVNLGTSPVQTTSQTASKYYRCKVTCSGVSTYSNPKLVHIKSFMDCYCQVTSTNTNYGITNFTTTNGISNISNPSGTGPYSNYSSLSVSQIQGQSVNFTINSANTSTSGMGIWIDWNDDGNFGAGEQVYNSGTYVNIGSGTITVPAAAIIGSHKMRVVANYLSTSPTPCGDLGSIGYGEAEDYTFIVLPATPCSGTPTAGVITSSATQLYQGQSFNLISGSTVSFGIGITYQWQSTPAGFNSWTNINGATNVNLVQIMPGVSTNYRIIVTCSNSSLTDTSNIVTVLLLAPNYVPVAVTGFDEDVIANGVGPAIGSTTNSVDAVDFALVAQDYKLNSTAIGPTKFVPNDRTISNLAKLFILRDYSQNNSLRRTSNQSGTLTFVTPKKAKQVAILGISGSGISTVNAILNFSDGTTQIANGLSWPDWFATTGTVVAAQVGRINRINNGLEAGNGPQLFENVITVNVANQTKQIDSITFNIQAGSNVMNVLAISIVPPDTVVCSTPSSLLVVNIQDHSATINWNSMGGINNYQLSYGLSGILPGNGNMVTVTNDTTYNLTGLNSATNYDVFVRRNCGSGIYSDWIGPISFQTLLENCSGTPTGGLASSTDTLICPSLPFTLNTISSTLANGINGIWQQSIDGGTTWNDIIGATSPSYFVTNGITVNSKYRFHITCALNSNDAYSNIVNVNIKPVISCYCTPAGSNSSYFINNFSTTGAVQNISNLNSGFSTAGYGDYSATDTVQQYISSSISFTIDGSTSGTYGFSIYVDWNQNGVFEPTEKAFGTSSYSANASGSFIVPATALGGVTRMRVGLHWLNSAGPGPCENTTYTEFEDYTFIVLVPCVPPIVQLGNDTTICAGSSLTLDAGNSNPGANYIWSNGGTAQTLSVNSTGSYSVTVTDGLCSVSDTINVTVAPLPIVNLGNDTAICIGSSLILDAGSNPGSAYLWNTGSTTQTINVNTSGTFYVTVTNSAACVTTDTIIVTVSVFPTVYLGNDTAFCSGNILTLDAQSNPGGTFLWNTGASTQSINVTTSGTYSVIKTNNAGCVANDTIEITVNPLPTINLGNDTTICFGTTLLLDASGNLGGTYLWNTGASTQTISVNSAGNYSATVTNSFGCVKSDTIQVSIAISPIVNLGNDTAICLGSSVTLDAGNNPGAVYSWNTGATTQTINVSVAGTYVVTASNSGTCQTKDTLVVSIIPGPPVNLGNDTMICTGDSITFNAGLISNATYLWNTGATSQSITVSSAGTFKVVVDNGVCSTVDSVHLTLAPLPQSVLGSNISTCEGTPVTLNAGNPGSTYLWNTGATTQSIVVNATGQYIVTTTNINNCSINDTANVIVRPLPIIDLGSDTTICDNSYLVLDAENPGSTYLWSTGSTNQIIIVNQEGVYSVLVTSAYGCQQTDNIELFIYDDATVDGFNFVPMVEIDPKRVDFWPINPESVTDYLWDFGDGNTSTVVAPSHTYDSEGYYLVSLTVSNECGSNDTSLLIHVDLVTGVKAVNNNIDVEVYPVPAQNKLTIETLSNGLKIKSVSLFSTLGQELHVINQINNSKTDLDITTLPSGNYFLKIETDKGMTMRRFNIVK